MAFLQDQMWLRRGCLCAYVALFTKNIRTKFTKNRLILLFFARQYDFNFGDLIL